MAMEACCPPPLEYGEVEIIEQGCCPRKFPEDSSQLDPRLQALMPPDAWRETLSRVNSKKITYIMYAVAWLITFMVIGTAVVLPIGAQYKRESYTCSASQAECDYKEAPYKDDCCRWWCCEDGKVRNEPAPVTDLFSQFAGRGCELTDVQGDDRCECYKQGNKKICFHTRLEGPFVENDAVTWPLVWIPLLIVIVAIAYSGLFLIIFKIFPKIAKSLLLDSPAGKAGAEFKFIGGTKHRPAAIRVRIPAGWQGAQQSQYAAAPNFHQAPPPQARMGYGSGVDGVSG